MTPWLSHIPKPNCSPAPCPLPPDTCNSITGSGSDSLSGTSQHGSHFRVNASSPISVSSSNRARQVKSLRESLHFSTNHCIHKELRSRSVSTCPAGADLAKRHDIAAIEVRNVIRLLREQPIGVQVGVVVDSMPGTSFQIFKQTNRSPVAISPFTLGSFANVRIGVATITTAQEAVDLYIEMTERLWRRSLKGDEAADYIEKLAFRS